MLLNMTKNEIEHSSKEEILKITDEQAYEWVKTGVWDFKTFKVWLDIIIIDAESNALEYQNL